MKEKRIRPQNIEWQQQKIENRKNNEALFTGWDGGVWRRGIMARQLFRGLTEAKVASSQ